MTLTLLTTDIEGEEFDWECDGYELQNRSGILKVFIDGEKFIELTPDDYGGGPLVLIDWHGLDVDEDSIEWVN